MIGFKLDQAKKMFFDAPAIMRAVDAATRKVLSRFGAFVRTAAQSSMLRHPVRKGFGAKSKVSDRAGVSKPGEPPFPHTGLLVKNIYFGYDRAQRSVVIGATRLNAQSMNAPEVLEYGGTSQIVTRRKGKRTMVPAKIAARPFMHPALGTELPKLPAMWRDSVKP